MQVLFHNNTSFYSCSIDIDSQKLISKVARVLKKISSQGVTEFKLIYDQNMAEDLFIGVEQSSNDDIYGVYMVVIIENIEYYSDILCEFIIETEGYTIISEV